MQFVHLRDICNLPTQTLTLCGLSSLLLIQLFGIGIHGYLNLQCQQQTRNNNLLMRSRSDAGKIPIKFLMQGVNVNPECQYPECIWTQRLWGICLERNSSLRCYSLMLSEVSGRQMTTSSLHRSADSCSLFCFLQLSY